MEDKRHYPEVSTHPGRFIVKQRIPRHDSKYLIDEEYEQYEEDEYKNNKHWDVEEDEDNVDGDVGDREEDDDEDDDDEDRIERRRRRRQTTIFGHFRRFSINLCISLSDSAYYLPQNAGDIARKYIQDPQLLSFIDAECFIVSTVKALQTPMINASMVMCDRHYGGINYPVGGVGGIAKSLAKGLLEQGSEILYKANVTGIILDQSKAVGVRLSDKREFFTKTIISNATRWDTFGKLLKDEDIPKEEENFQKVYVKAPSFLSIHMGGNTKDTQAIPRYLAREEGTYGPLPRRTPKGLLGMSFDTTAIGGLYCAGDSCFPGQGVIAVSFSGVMCAYRVAADIGLEKKSRILDAGLLGLHGWFRTLA